MKSKVQKQTHSAILWSMSAVCSRCHERERERERERGERERERGRRERERKRVMCQWHFSVHSNSLHWIISRPHVPHCKWSNTMKAPHTVTFDRKAHIRTHACPCSLYKININKHPCSRITSQMIMTLKTLLCIPHCHCLHMFSHIFVETSHFKKECMTFGKQYFPHRNAPLTLG